MNTPIYRKGGNCISKTLSVSKGIPLNISHTHKDTHKHAVRLLPNRGKTKWTNTNTHGEGSEGLKPADDSSWIHTPRNKNTENLLGEVVFEQVLAGCRMCGVISVHYGMYVKRQKWDKQNQIRFGAERQTLCKTRTPNSDSNVRLISGLISFRAGHSISGHWYPSLLSQELISHFPSSSLLVCDGISVTACNAGLYALIIWHPLFRCAIKVPLLSSFLLCRRNNVQ